MTRAARKAQAREKSSRARAAQRLQACAAVFVRSHIQFDACRVVPPFAATDRLPGARADVPRLHGGVALPARGRDALRVTFH